MGYHLELLGIDLFRVYDLDGSYEVVVQRFVMSGLVEYLPRFGHTLHPRHFGGSVQSCPLCSEVIVYQDCLVNLRGRARWVLNIGSPNKWLHPMAGFRPPPVGSFRRYMKG